MHRGQIRQMPSRPITRDIFKLPHSVKPGLSDRHPAVKLNCHYQPTPYQQRGLHLRLIVPVKIANAELANMFAQNTLQAAKRFVLAWIERAMGAVHPYETTLSAFVLAGVCVFVASKNNASLRACLRQLFPLLDIPRLLKYRVAWFMNSDLDTIAIQQEFQRHWSSGTETRFQA